MTVKSLSMDNNVDAVSAGFNEFGFNTSSRLSKLVSDLKYFLLHNTVDFA